MKNTENIKSFVANLIIFLLAITNMNRSNNKSKHNNPVQEKTKYFEIPCINQ